jgi:UDP-glucose:(heptosyl)LPS alpha-1,3-glucosyltransferase
VLYPQGGLHAASRAHNQLKYRNPALRLAAAALKLLDPAALSFARLERRQYLGTRRPVLVVNSRMVRKHFERYYGIAPGTVRVVPSAIDPARFAADDRPRRRQEVRERWGVAADEPVGLFVAMNYRLKGLEQLIRAAAIVPRDNKFRLAIVGHPRFERYQRLSRSLGVNDRFRFLGFRADPKDAYFAADFLVHPTFYDPCSLVVLEAMACGLPVITTRYNGASELMTVPENGLVINDPHDAAELGGAITRVLASDYRRSAAAAARQAAGRWTFEHHYRALLDVLLDVRTAKQAA